MSPDRLEILAELDCEQDLINPLLPRTADGVVEELSLRGRARALDLACGTGGWTIRLAKRDVEVDAVDTQPRFLEQARRRAVEAGVDRLVRFREVDAVECAATAGGYDLVLQVGASFLWGCPEDPVRRMELALAAVRRCVRAGGVVLFGEPHIRNPVPGFLTRSGLEEQFRRARLNPEAYWDDGEAGWSHYLESREPARRRLRDAHRGEREMEAVLSDLEAEGEWEAENLSWGLWRLRV